MMGEGECFSSECMICNTLSLCKQVLRLFILRGLSLGNLLHTWLRSQKKFEIPKSEVSV